MSWLWVFGDHPEEAAQNAIASLRNDFDKANWAKVLPPLNKNSPALSDLSQTLRVETLASAIVHWSGDGWRTTQDVATHDVGLGIYSADLGTKELSDESQVDFTSYWRDAHRWEGDNFAVRVGVEGELA